MRITRVALSFFAVGFVAGTFEQAAGLGDAQHGQRTAAVASSASVAPSSVPAVVPAATTVASKMPSIIGPLGPPTLVLEGVLRPEPVGLPPLDMGDGRAAETVAAAFGSDAKAGELGASAGSAPSPKLRPFFVQPELPPLVVPEPQVAERPKEFIMPMQYGRVTSMFHQGRHHPAIDLAAPLGTPVRATTRKQKVTFAGRRGGYGNLVITRDPTGRQHYYGHLQRIVAGIGTLLEQGDLLGLLGSTGRSTGPHVHYEVRKGTGSHFNPAALLFPGLSVQRGYTWNDGRAPTVAAARSGTVAAARTDGAESAQATRRMHRRTARGTGGRARFAARAPAVRHYRTQRATRYGTTYAARSGQPRPR